ncbi:MAG: hypothetical protein ACYSUI_07940 [Planctomycetota bacterium]|jgi:hypothetical protein
MKVPRVPRISDFPALKIPALNIDWNAMRPDSPAESVVDSLQKMFERMNSNVADDAVVLVYCCTQDGDRILVGQVGYTIPGAVIVYGEDADGRPCTAVLGAGAAQFVFVVTKKDEGEDRPKIGFLNEMQRKDDANT